MSLIDCKCGCGQKIESCLAYKVPFNGVSFKFLNEDHANKWRDKSIKNKNEINDPDFIRVYNLFIDIFGKDINAKYLLVKEFNEWKNITSVDKIYGYIAINVKKFSNIINFKKLDVFHGIKYLSAIIKNEAPKYTAQAVLSVGVNEQISVENKNISYKKKKSLSELEDEA